MVIDYHTERFEQRVQALEGIFDCVGGETLQRSWNVLKPCGRMITIVGENENTRDARGNEAFFIVEPTQAVLLDAFPNENQGAAQTVFGVAALLAPVVGPTLGGYITDNYGWRWIFYVNIPTGLLALWMCSKLVYDPDYLKAQQFAMRKKGAPFDTLGL